VHGSSRILKGNAPLPARRIDGAVWDTDLRVRQMIAAAEEEARRVRAEAHAEQDRLRADAAAAGRVEGLAQAAAELARAAEARDRLLAGARAEVVEVAVALARRVLGREVEAGRAAEDVAAAALAEVRDRRTVSLRVHPGDAARLRASRERLEAVLVRGTLALREDPGVSAGGAVVETEAGTVDARIETQLDALAAALRGEVAP
jgi:flagellar biosynthesis/type III secretory pathway protein FliH